jgi:hypothetical protein
VPCCGARELLLLIFISVPL